MRTRRRALEIAIVAAISAASWWLVVRWWEKPELAAALIVAGTVTVAICGSSTWSFVIGAVDDVRATDRGLAYNGTEWPWNQVTRIRAIVSSRADKAWGSVTVRRRGRSAMSIPFEIGGRDVESLEELREYLTARGYDLDWRVKHY